MRLFTLGSAAWLGVAIVVTAGLSELPTARAGDAVVKASAGRAACALVGDKACSRGSCCGTWWCPNDYRPKPCPVVCLPRACGRCDDYRPKRIPCVCPPSTCGFSNDYCPKPAPCVSVPCRWPSFYKCPLPLPPLRCGR